MKTPAEYDKNDTVRNAYAKGFNHGHGFACHNVPEMGAKLFVENLGRVTVNEENIREVHESLCFAAESNSRDFSPWEFTAHEFNSLGEDEDCECTSEEAWEAYEAAVSAAIFGDLETYTDEDYGIVSDVNA